MKNVLIFGAGSYIGNALEKYLNNKGDLYQVTTIESKGCNVAETDFSSYDVVYYVAGIAHQKETEENAHLYYEVNRDLAIAVAKKAKQDGVKQFILMSTLSVYGLIEGVINSSTNETPTTHYGKSKLEADQEIIKLNDHSFHVAIIRPPMVYGAGCKGNYQRLRSLSLKTPIFPNIKNQRSMIYIDNLVDYIEYVIREDITGIHIPQNQDYVCTTEMVKYIAESNGKKVHIIPFPQWMIRKLPITTVKKVFGTLICEQTETHSNIVKDFKMTIEMTEMPLFQKRKENRDNNELK